MAIPNEIPTFYLATRSRAKFSTEAILVRRKRIIVKMS